MTATQGTQLGLSRRTGDSARVTRAMSTPPDIATLDYLAEAAKDWTLSRFAAAESSDFTFAAHRFELDGHTVRRRRLSRRSREAADPLQVVGRARCAVARARSAIITLLADSESGTVEFQQEIVEILAVESDDVLVEAATARAFQAVLPVSAGSRQPPDQCVGCLLRLGSGGLAAGRRPDGGRDGLTGTESP